MEILAIAGLLFGGWLVIKWVVGAVLYVIYFIVGDIGEHIRGECGCYRDRDDY